MAHNHQQQQQQQQKYKLYYFDLRGRAEPIRLLLHYVGQDFEDVRFTYETWPEAKQKFFYGMLPVLELPDGKQLAQSAAILRYIAEKHNLVGKDEWERAKVDEVLEFNTDVFNQIASALPLYENLLKQSGSGFFAPSGPTVVDFVVAEYMESLVSRAEPHALKDHPEMEAYVKRVLGLPQLHKYMTERKTQ